jgi:DNA topoisomerase-6 subunit B
MTTQEMIAAEEMASKMREVSIAEFFEKNRHLLGYENPTKSLITIVKECVDNSLDASEEANILPDIKVSVKEVGVDRFRIAVEDNGPGIIEEKLSFAFGKLLYGSKFHRLRQSRGTQGIGISGAILYSQLTTGKPTKITSSTGKDINTIELMIDVVKNEPKIISHKKEKNPSKWHGIKIELEAEGRYIEKSQSVPEYLKETAISNPYAKIVYDGPNGKTVFERVVNELPRRPKEIKPHPYGVEVGLLRRMLLSTKARNIIGFLTSDFSRVGKSSAEQICRLAKIEKTRKPHELTHEETERLHKSMQMVKLVSPPTDCLSPLGENLITKGLKKELDAEYLVAITRPPSVYRGNPFLVEVGLAFGGTLPQEKQALLLRFSNKVPLLYHQSDCAITEAVGDVDWRRYGFSQSQGQLPAGSLAILVHLASVWVPYTSEGKQAIANYTEIIKEIKLALQDAGRKLAIYVRRQKKERDKAMRKGLFEKYIPEVSAALSEISGHQRSVIEKDLKKILNKENIIESSDQEVEKVENGEESGNGSEE